KRRGGTEPFRELARHGPIALGGAVLTSAGSLPLKGIIHVAAINMLWRASEESIRTGTRSAIQIVNARAFESVALPVLGSGSGGFAEEQHRGSCSTPWRRLSRRRSPHSCASDDG